MSYQPISISTANTTETNVKRFEKYIAETPLTLEKLRNIVPPVSLNVNGVSIVDASYVPLGLLLDSDANDPITQRSIDTARVFKVIFGDITTKVQGFVQQGDHPELLSIITVGVHADGTISVQGGRHRLTALATVIAASGLDLTSEEVRSIPVRVHLDNYSAEKVIADNCSRTVRKSENVSVQLQNLGIDPSDFNSILAGFSRPAKEVNPALLFVAFFVNAVNAQDADGTLNPAVAALSVETIADIAGSVISKFKTAYPAYKTGFNDSAWTTVVLKLAYNQLANSVNKVRETGVTNIARAASTVASSIVYDLKGNLGKEIGTPAPKVAKVKVTKEETADGEATPAKPKRERKSKASPATTEAPESSEVQEEAVPS